MGADAFYKNRKIPFAFDYAEKDSLADAYDHSDSYVAHGSHVAGIAAANRFVPDSISSTGYTDALAAVKTQGVAPNAQIIAMKVFGTDHDASDSDYMAAIEDAIVLGCDSINLSLGSPRPGFSRSSTTAYQAIMDSLKAAGAVVSISAGNSSEWQRFSGTDGNLYNTDVSMQTIGTPGSYTNAFTVASVENIGSTGKYMTFGENKITYSEQYYGNNLLSTLDTSENHAGKEYAFILFDHAGLVRKEGNDDNVAVGSLQSDGIEDDAAENTDTEYLNLLSEYSDVIKGRIVLVQFADIPSKPRQEAIASLGGKACIIMRDKNTFMIDTMLDGSNTTIPCVSISYEDTQTIKERAAPKMDSGGNVLYYTGELTIHGDYDASSMTMARNTSWGVPGSLELKPEITAPGGNIYSVDGCEYSSTGYKSLSGTSMAAPQVAGMAAVLAQYIREKNLTQKTGLTARQLAQSLLMSTATPLKETERDNYVSLLQQGAGLADVSAAITANSYVIMGSNTNAGAQDGKVKVELGDAPDRRGIYTFQYMLKNLTNEIGYYKLSTSVFSQDVDGTDGTLYLSTNTWPLEKVSVTYSEVTPDANNIVTIPANGRITVTVTINLNGCGFAQYPNGAYIEAYSFAAQVNADGTAMPNGTTHTIPVLGFYGSWTDASMYDVGTYPEYYNGTDMETPYVYTTSEYWDENGYGVTKTPYYETNALTVRYAGSGDAYPYTGNPLYRDSAWTQERNAFNSENDTALVSYRYTPIRSAGGALLRITNANNPKEVYWQAEQGQVTAAYYASGWQDYSHAAYLNWSLTDANGNPLSEGTKVDVSLILAPEYYADEEGTYNWTDLTNGKLGEGAYLTTSFTVDNTAPTLRAVSYTDNDLTVTAQDNCYLAAVELYRRDGEEALAYALPAQAESMTDATCTLELAELGLGASDELYIKLTDYAMNQSTWKLTLGSAGQTVSPGGVVVSPAARTVIKGMTAKLTAEVTPWGADETLVWSSSNERIATVDQNGVVTGIRLGTAVITAASARDKKVFGSCLVTVETANVTLTGAVRDITSGDLSLFTWDISKTGSLNAYAGLTNPFCAAACDAKNNVIYQVAPDVNSTSCYVVDFTTGKAAFSMENILRFQDITIPQGDRTDTTLVGAAPLYLMRYAVEYDETAQIYALNYGGLCMLNDELRAVGAKALTAVTWISHDEKTGFDTFWCMADDGTLLRVSTDFTYDETVGYRKNVEVYQTDLELNCQTDEWLGTCCCSMVSGDDGNLYLSYFNGKNSEIYRLQYNQTTKSCVSALLARTESDVYPCALLKVSANSTAGGGTDSPDRPSRPAASAKPAAPAKAEPFSDVKQGDWYYDAVHEVYKAGLMNGVGEKQFAPNAKLTRAMLAVILYRLDGGQKTAESPDFTDVATGSWYEDAVNWCAANGIAAGYGNSVFGTEDPITRQQLAAILHRYARYKGFDVSANSASLPGFDDCSNIASWAIDAVTWAYSWGIMTGRESKLDPTGTASRAEIAVMLTRFMAVSNAKASN